MTSTECRMLRGAPACCGVCHEDYQWGTRDPVERDVDGLIAQVCCAVARWLDTDSPSAGR